MSSNLTSMQSNISAAVLINKNASSNLSLPKENYRSCVFNFQLS